MLALNGPNGDNGTTTNIKPAVFGTTVLATVGDKDGNWTYTSVLWQNHFPVLAEGAIALYANLVSLGYKDTPGWAYSGKYSKDSQKIQSADVEVTAPVANETPDSAATVLSGHCSAGAVTWSPADAAFVNGSTYTASVTITADDWCIFDVIADNVTINGNPASIVTKTDKTLTIATELSEAIADLKVKPNQSFDDRYYITLEASRADDDSFVSEYFIRNDADSDVEVIVVAAIYDQRGIMRAIEMVTVAVAKGAKVTGTVPIAVPPGLEPNEVTMKTFIWSGLNWLPMVHDVTCQE